MRIRRRDAGLRRRGGGDAPAESTPPPVNHYEPAFHADQSQLSALLDASHPLRLPALSERGDDVLLLADFFAAKYATAYGMGPQVFVEDARTWLASYDWPGNVRELQNLMERAVLLAQVAPPGLAALDRSCPTQGNVRQA